MVEQAGGDFAGVDRVEQDAFGLAHGEEGVQGGFGWVAVLATDVAVVQFVKAARATGRDVEQLGAGGPPVGEVFFAGGAVAVHADADHGAVDAAFAQGKHGAREDASGPEGSVDRVERDFFRGELVHDFEAGGDVAEAAGGRGAADGDVVRVAALSVDLDAALAGVLFEVPVVGGLDDDDIDAHQVDGQEVALERTVLIIAEDDAAGHAESSGGGGSEARVIALGAAAGDECVGTVGAGGGDFEFEFAGFVAAEREVGEVVALDPEVDAELRAERGEGVEGRRESREGFARVTSQGRLDVRHVGPPGGTVSRLGRASM